MSKKLATVTPLPTGLAPTEPTAKTIGRMLDRAKAHGTAQKSVAADLGVGANNPSMWKSGASKLPLPRVLQLAAAAGLSHHERKALLFDRLIELHGKEGQICLETMAQWAVDHFTPTGDDAKLLGLYHDARGDAAADPLGTLDGLLDDPAVALRVHTLFTEIVGEHIARQRVA